MPHFSKPRTAFLGDMFYGLMAGGDVKLSKICRAYRPTITMKKAGDRLCMHLDDERIEKTLHSFIARKVARRVKPDTLIIVDPSDIQKPYATQMDFLSKVWDGSKGAVGDNLGYYGCMALARLGKRIPDDVAVVGFDDIEAARLANPPLTTISQPVRKLAATETGRGRCAAPRRFAMPAALTWRLRRRARPSRPCARA